MAEAKKPEEPKAKEAAAPHRKKDPVMSFFY